MQGLNSRASYSAEALNEEYALLSNAAEMEIRRYLDTVAERLEQAGATVIPEVSFNNPAGDILLFAKHYHADLIVMATHGRTGISRLLHGSVTETVLEHTHCPMLVVRVHATEHAAQQPVEVEPTLAS
jgi:nucleotide-binding universal stress UspA family protein